MRKIDKGGLMRIKNQLAAMINAAQERKDVTTYDVVLEALCVARDLTITSPTTPPLEGNVRYQLLAMAIDDICQSRDD